MKEFAYLTQTGKLIILIRAYSKAHADILKAYVDAKSGIDYDVWLERNNLVEKRLEAIR